MTSTASQSATVGDYAEIIRGLHLVDKRNRATRTRRAIVLGTLLAVLGGAALTGRASTDSGYARGDACTAHAS